MPSEGNALGRFSLAVGIVAATLVFGAILCAAAGVAQGWLRLVATPLYICTATTVFLALIGILLGVAGLFGRGQRRGTAVAGLALSLLAVCMFLFALSRLR